MCMNPVGDGAYRTLTVKWKWRRLRSRAAEGNFEQLRNMFFVLYLNRVSKDKISFGNI
jgi:hypothetical protein